MTETVDYQGPAVALTVTAPAKINLCLHVLGRRPDGFHEVAMLMQAVSLCDSVRIDLAPGDGVSLASGPQDLGPEVDNLVVRAARALLAATGIRAAVHLTLDKQIPVAAGLGGGSSDAAAVLQGLDFLLRQGVAGAALEPLAAGLGSDVPFFLRDSGLAWATGTGTTLQSAPALPPVYYVLVNPNTPLSTAWVYRNLALTSFSEAANLPTFFRSPEAVVRLFHNTLETVAIPACPVIGEIKACLREAGALGALMSGSGPTVFGLFASAAAAGRAAEMLARKSSWWVQTVQPVVRMAQEKHLFPWWGVAKR